ncbi:MAG TPA: hypothetical protein PKJ85_11530 [Nitrosomonas nitrosa]|nr:MULTISPECIES: hypothetical protein [Nitrosomonas]HNP52408.1 hypothetical protein [Nitrosomonas nitrosa]
MFGTDLDSKIKIQIRLFRVLTNLAAHICTFSAHLGAFLTAIFVILSTFFRT